MDDSFLSQAIFISAAEMQPPQYVPIRSREASKENLLLPTN
jgi:hypothetical protein